MGLAEQHKLNAWYFKVEQALKQLDEPQDERPSVREASVLSEAPSVREMEIGLREYAATAAL
jgi:hypothetical protein